MPALPTRLVILGPQGSGKGTQAEALSRILGAVHVASGDAIRAEIRRGTPLGKMLEGYVTAGRLVPDALVLELVHGLLQPAPAWILDGYPRTEAQARALDDILNAADVKIDAVIALEAPDNVLVERIAGRVESQATGIDYHVLYNPPPPSDPGPFVPRSDDTPRAIAERLKIYHRATEPLEAYYAMRGILHRVDAAQPVAEVTAHIVSSLGLAGSHTSPVVNGSVPA
jgi:adenylate kinase